MVVRQQIDQFGRVVYTAPFDRALDLAVIDKRRKKNGHHA